MRRMSPRPSPKVAKPPQCIRSGGFALRSSRGTNRLLVRALSCQRTFVSAPSMTRFSFICIAWLSVIAAIGAAEPTGFRIQRDVGYLSEDRAEKADLYLPLTIAKG